MRLAPFPSDVSAVLATWYGVGGDLRAGLFQNFLINSPPSPVNSNLFRAGSRQKGRGPAPLIVLFSQTLALCSKLWVARMEGGCEGGEGCQHYKSPFLK